MYSWDEKCPYESDKAYGYFLSYLELGLNRNVAKLHKKVNKEISYNTLQDYHKKYHWEERSKSYDQYNNAKKKALLEEEKDEYFETRRKALKGYDEIIDSVLASIVSGIMDGDIDPIKATQSIQTLCNSMTTVGKYHLRLLNEPEVINDVLRTEQDIDMKHDDEHQDILSTEFMNNELDVLRKLIKDD